MARSMGTGAYSYWLVWIYDGGRRMAGGVGDDDDDACCVAGNESEAAPSP